MQLQINTLQEHSMEINELYDPMIDKLKNINRLNKLVNDEQENSSYIINYRVWQKFCDIFCFACISFQEHDKTLIFFLKDALSNSLQTSIGLNL